MAFNVYYLRLVHPGLLSGKLSDLAINFLLPVLLLAVLEWGWFLLLLARRRAFVSLGKAGVVVACLVSAGYFTALKAVPAFTPWHVALLRLLAAPFPVSTAFRNVADPWDLLTLVTTPLAARYLLRAEPPKHHGLT